MADAQRVTDGPVFEVRKVTANGLSHRVLVASPAPSGAPLRHGSVRPIVLLHGYMDAAGTWDLVARHLTSGGRRVLAPELRGFGGAPRTPAGSYYHFADYVADVEGALAALEDGPVDLVGHSMGGAVATYFTAAFPDRVRKLAVLEGLGPPDMTVRSAPSRLRQWIEEVRAMRRRSERPPMRREEALARLAANHPGVDRAVLASRLPHLVREEGEGVVWAFDPLHRTPSPSPFLAEYFKALAEAVPCPTLYVSGGPTGYQPPDAEERLRAFARLERRELPGAGHMMHWTAPAELSAALLGFFEAP